MKEKASSSGLYATYQHKALTGISGFDEMTGGGLPRNRISLISGSAGSGKTIFAMQCLVNGAILYDEPGLFVSFEPNLRAFLLIYEEVKRNKIVSRL